MQVQLEIAKQDWQQFQLHAQLGSSPKSLIAARVNWTGRVQRPARRSWWKIGALFATVVAGLVAVWRIFRKRP